jgi:hypothetical protein
VRLLLSDGAANTSASRAGIGYRRRRRYFTINWIQFVTTWAAFALFLVALISLQAARSPTGAGSAFRRA